MKATRRRATATKRRKIVAKKCSTKRVLKRRKSGSIIKRIGRWLGLIFSLKHVKAHSVKKAALKRKATKKAAPKRALSRRKTTKVATRRKATSRKAA